MNQLRPDKVPYYLYWKIFSVYLPPPLPSQIQYYETESHEAYDTVRGIENKTGSNFQS